MSAFTQDFLLPTEVLYVGRQFIFRMSPRSHTNAVFNAVFTQSSTHINGTQQYSWQVAAHDT